MRQIAFISLMLMAAAACRRECPEQSLADRFTSARSERETWLIDFGSPGSREHLVSGFSGDGRWGEPQFSFVWSTAPVSVLQLNRFGVIATRIRFRCAAEQDSDAVTIAINGRDAATKELHTEFAIYDFAVPAESFRLGANRIELRYAHGGPVAWDWLEILEPHAKPHMRALHRDSDTIMIPYRAAIRYDLPVKANSTFVADGIDIEGDPTEGGSIVLNARAGDGKLLASFHASTGPREVRFALPPAQQLEIIAMPPLRGAPGATGLKLRRPRIAGQCK